MVSKTISLDSIDKVKLFVHTANTLTDIDMDIVSTKYVVNARSIMGIFSLDLSKPLELIFHISPDDANMPKILATFNEFYI